jgi:hypothetical protein
LSIASAIRAPISGSLFAETEPTWAISLDELIFLDIDLSSSTIAATALSMPRLTSLGFAPAVMFFSPSAKIDSA